MDEQVFTKEKLYGRSIIAAARKAKEKYDIRRTNAILRIGSGREDEAELNAAMNELSASLAEFDHKKG